MSTPLVETTRGVSPDRATRENVHYGSIAVVDLRGKLLFYAGDPHALCFTRSTLKPLQAMPFVLDGGLHHFHFGSRELALMCASHSGEPQHVEVVNGILDGIGCSETDLACGTQVPLYYSAHPLESPPATRWTQVHHNCSGKHCGFLAWCRLHETSTRDYVATDHAVQVRVRDLVGRLAGVDSGFLPVGTDGCSVPNYALPLDRLAHFYVRLAQGPADPQYGLAFEAIFDAMTAHPELVSGSGRTDVAYMRTAPGDWISKAGADGMQVLASRSARLGIAVKISDGSARAIQVAFVEVLRQLGLLDSQPSPLLEPLRQLVLRNNRGVPTGSVLPIFKLRPAS